MIKRGMDRLQAYEEPAPISLTTNNFEVTTINPTADMTVAANPLLVDGVDQEILNAMAPGTKQAYKRYKKLYKEQEIDIHSEESVLNFLMKLHTERGFKPTTLWTVRSLVLSYLRHELKIKVTDMKTSKWLKQKMGIPMNS